MRKSALATSILFVFFIIISISCDRKPEKGAKYEKIRVVVSILPQVEFLERIGGEKVEICLMIPTGESPTTYEPTPNQLAYISKAEIYARVGPDFVFELAWMDRILSLNPSLRVLDCSEGIDRIPGDPHTWLSPKLTKRIIENLCQGLVKLDPENMDYYVGNRDNYLLELSQLDKNFTQVLAKRKNRKFLVYHPAWTYFARDYNLEQIAIEKEGKDPSLKWIIRLIHQAKQHKIKTIFASPQFNTRNAEVISKEIGGKVVFIDPLEKNYLNGMKKFFHALLIN